MGKGGRELRAQAPQPISAVDGEGGLYDVKAVSPVVRKALYSDVKRRYPWDTYLLGYLALAAYVVCAAGAWRQLVAGCAVTNQSIGSH